ncbi:hypothetical protein D3C73_1238260 [compost metagenome]
MAAMRAGRAASNAGVNQRCSDTAAAAPTSCVAAASRRVITAWTSSGVRWNTVLNSTSRVTRWGRAAA